MVRHRPIPYINFGKIRKARLLAADKHSGKYRKERISPNKLPYIVHTDGVANDLLAMGAGEDLIIAGHLHDTLEDTNLTAAEIKAVFGPRVLFLVKAVTEPKGKSWMVRKKSKIKALQSGDLEVKMLGAADHCDNLLSLLEFLHREGLAGSEEFKTAAVWKKFKQGYELQKWYHQESCRAIFANVPYEMMQPLFGKLMRLVETIFGEIIISDSQIRRKVRRRKQNRSNPCSPGRISEKQKP